MGRAFRRGEDAPSLVKAVLPLVGRTEELRWFEGWLQDAINGRPHIVLVQGEAGIGKTRLLQQVRSIAGHLRMETCFGRCYEDLTFPYVAFAESLLPRLEAAHKSEGSGPDDDFADLARLRRGTKAAARTVASSMSGDADHEKLRLFLAVARATVKLARTSPLVFVVDDLHWADGLSLDLFDHLAFTMVDTAAREPVPLLIIGTHRPVGGDERLARLRARLQREEHCTTITLEGLNELEVHDLIGDLGVARPSHQLTATVSEATRGNPFFVQEVLHHLIREHGVQEQGGYLVTAVSPSELPLPGQIMGAVVARTRGIGEPGRRLLSLASCLGDRFSLAVLAGVSGLAEDELLDLLEDAIRQGLLRSEGQGFQFAHPLIRHVLYQEPSVPRRQRLHKQIAETLLRLHVDDAEAHLVEIAHHLVRAGPAADPDTVVEYARRAADQAFQVFAWSEAANYYEAALAAATPRLSTEERAHLHYSAGLAHYYNQDVGPCLHHYGQAIDAYRAADDVRGLARALMERTRTQFTLATVPLGTVADLAPLEDILVVLDDQEPGLRGHILAVMSEAYRNGRQADKARQRGQQALEIGRQLGDDHLCAYASFALALAHINDLHVTPALEGWQAALVYARRARDFIREGWALHRIPLAHTLLGALDDAERVGTEACEVTRRSQDWGNHSLGLSHLACVAVARGDFERAERQTHESMLMVSRFRYPWGGLRALLALACARALRGAWAEAEDALDVVIEPGRVFEDPGPVVRTFVTVFRQLLRGYAGRGGLEVAAAAADLMKIVGTDTYSLAPLCAIVELADLGGAPAVATAPYAALSRAAERGVLFSSGWMFLLPRVLGVAATIDGRWDAAEHHFQTAIDRATRVGARPELARACADYARMLVLRGAEGDRPRASELVRQASGMFVALGMQPFVQRTRGLAGTLDVELAGATEEQKSRLDDLSAREIEVLIRMARGRTGPEIAGDLVLAPQTVASHMNTIFDKVRVRDEAGAAAYAVKNGLVQRPVSGHAPAARPSAAGRDRPLHIILVTDVVASSALIVRSGDAKAHDLMQLHNAIIRRCLATHEGLEITHTGDGIEASFSTAASGVECAIEIQRAFARHNHEQPTDHIQVRIGINAGEPISTEGRLFGAAVHATFRICGRAQPSQILVSDVVSQLVAGREFTMASRGVVSLKGLGRMRLHEVRWHDEDT